MCKMLFYILFPLLKVKIYVGGWGFLFVMLMSLNVDIREGWHLEHRMGRFAMVLNGLSSAVSDLHSF